MVCGADPPLYGDRMCEPCVRKRIKLVQVPENIPWVRCARCGIVEIQGKWVHISEEEIWDELIQRHVQFHKNAEDVGLALETRTVSDRHTLLHLQVEGVIEDLLFQEEHTMRARMANGVCLTCTRRAGNYFEATVQLRSTGRRLSEEEFTVLRQTLDKVIEDLSDDQCSSSLQKALSLVDTMSYLVAKASLEHGVATWLANTVGTLQNQIQLLGEKMGST